MTRKEVRESANRVTKELADKGLIIEGGYAAFIILCGLQNATKEQKRQLEQAFYAGAQHLFGSIMSILEEGQEPTAGDLRRLDLIDQELNRWVESFEKNN